MCVFADGSAIDEFGIWYDANGTVRSVDIAPMLKVGGDVDATVYPTVAAALEAAATAPAEPPS